MQQPLAASAFHRLDMSYLGAPTASVRVLIFTALSLPRVLVRGSDVFAFHQHVPQIDLPTTPLYQILLSAYRASTTPRSVHAMSLRHQHHHLDLPPGPPLPETAAPTAVSPSSPRLILVQHQGAFHRVGIYPGKWDLLQHRFPKAFADYNWQACMHIALSGHVGGRMLDTCVFSTIFSCAVPTSFLPPPNNLRNCRHSLF